MLNIYTAAIAVILFNALVCVVYNRYLYTRKWTVKSLIISGFGWSVLSFITWGLYWYEYGFIAACIASIICSILCLPMMGKVRPPVSVVDIEFTGF